MKNIKLNNGVEIPAFGLGFWQMENNQVDDALKAAIDIGYRHIDTASAYKNEQDIGDTLEKCGVPREEFFITTKVWTNAIRADKIMESLDESLAKLKTDYVDLFLLHWPVRDKLVDAWKGMEEVYASGKARAIGVSNYLIKNFEDFLSTAKVIPAVNQIEFHPYFQDNELIKYCAEKGIEIEAWAPIAKGRVVNDPVINQIAAQVNKNAVQVVLRWEVQKNIIVFPKSKNTARLAENIDIFDFELNDVQMKKMDDLNEMKRLGEDPATFPY